MDYSEGIKFKPNDALLYYQRGRAYSMLGNKTQARTDYNKAYKLDPKLVKIFINYTRN
jgi:Flp pilus assembly protein TadD